MLCKMSLLGNVVIVCYIIVCYNFIIPIVGESQNFGLCADTLCSKVIARGHTNLAYNSPSDMKLSFSANEEVLIYVRNYGGPKEDLLGVVCNGIRGYIGKQFIIETSTIEKKLVPAVADFRLIEGSLNSGIRSDVISSSPLQYSDINNQPEISPSVDIEQTTITNTHQAHHFEAQFSDQDQDVNHNFHTPEVSQNLQDFDRSSDISFQVTDNHMYSNSLEVLPSPSTYHASMGDKTSITETEPFESSHHAHSSNADEHMNSIQNSKNIVSSTGSLLISPSTREHQNVSDIIFPLEHFVETPQIHPSASIISDSSNVDNYHLDVSETLAKLKERGVDESDILGDENYNYPVSSTVNVRPLPSGLNAQQNGYAYVKPLSNRVFENIHTSSSNFHQMSSEAGHMLVDAQSKFFTHNTDDVYGNESMDGEDDTFVEDIETEEEETENDDDEDDDDLESGLLDDTDSGVELDDVNNVAENPPEIAERFSAGENVYISIKPETMHAQTQDQNSILKDKTVNQMSKASKIMTVKETSLPEQTESSIAQMQTSKKDDLVSMPTHSDSFSHDIKESTIDSDGLVPHHSQTYNFIHETSSTQLHNDVLQTFEGTIDASLEQGKFISVVSSSFQIQPSEMNRDTKSYGIENLDTELKTVQNTDSDVLKKLEITQDLSYTKVDSLISHLTNNEDKPESNAYQNINEVKSNVAGKYLLENNKQSAERDMLNHNFKFDSDSIKNKLQIEGENDSEIPQDENSSHGFTKMQHVFASKVDSDYDSLASSYHIRDLKGDHSLINDQNSDSEVDEENSTQSTFDIYSSFENYLEALRSFIEASMMWIPEPIYSYIMDLKNKGIPPRATVFTALTAFPCLLIVITTVYIKESSKEKKLSGQLMAAEKNLYSLSAGKNLLEEELENVKSELSTIELELEEEKKSVIKLKSKLEYSHDHSQDINAELKTSLQTIDFLQKKEEEYVLTLSDVQKERKLLIEQTEYLEKRLKEEEESITSIAAQLQESEEEIKEFQDEKQSFLQSEEEYVEKIAQLQQNCNQLLQEAEVWNMRVSELTVQLNTEVSLKEEYENIIKAKDEEIESLKHVIQSLQSFEECCFEECDSETKEQQLKSLMDASSVMMKLEKEIEEKEILSEKLILEKNKVLSFEVELLDAKSEIDKLKLSYNQALQDKAEAQTKLDVLTNYFKDKEIQLQKELGVQEAVRQRKEEDASSAERRICLIEEENSSYKYQVASMKQEIEETERNLKSQISAQEKKAHENWLAARAAERKLEDVKQEVTQLRQRLTLLEREQESWLNSSRENVIRPVPKRFPGPNDEIMNAQEGNSTLESHMPPLMLPPDRPLPPLPPPPLPAFMPPLDTMMPFHPHPWHLNSDSFPAPEFRATPPDFMREQELTPPRSRQSAVHDREPGPHTSSPLGADARDSCNSTPPHALPHFHDIPPPPPRPFFPPPGMHSRFPLPPPYRREHPSQGLKRIDNHPADVTPSISRGSQQQPRAPQERWQHTNARV